MIKGTEPTSLRRMNPSCPKIQIRLCSWTRRYRLKREDRSISKGPSFSTGRVRYRIVLPGRPELGIAAQAIHQLPGGAREWFFGRARPTQKDAADRQRRV